MESKDTTVHRERVVDGMETSNITNLNVHQPVGWYGWRLVAYSKCHLFGFFRHRNNDTQSIRTRLTVTL